MTYYAQKIKLVEFKFNYALVFLRQLEIIIIAFKSFVRHTFHKVMKQIHI